MAKHWKSYNKPSVGILCLLLGLSPGISAAADRDFMVSCDNPNPEMRHPNCANRESPSNRDGGLGSALVGAIGIVALGYVAKKIYDNHSPNNRKSDANDIGRNLVNTGGDWFIARVEEGNSAVLFDRPNSNLLDSQRLAIIPHDARGIKIVGKCLYQLCPIKINSEYNYGIGWIHSNLIEKSRTGSAYYSSSRSYDPFGSD